jgi:hypothetical protein
LPLVIVPTVLPKTLVHELPSASVFKFSAA